MPPPDESLGNSLSSDFRSLSAGLDAAPAPPPGATLELRVPAERGSARLVRQAVRRWLAGAGVAEHDLSDILVACGEAVANAIEHANGPVDATVEVNGTLDQGNLTLTIRDQGRWRAARGGEARGRGLPMMDALMDEVTIDRGGDGTEVVLHRRLA